MLAGVVSTTAGLWSLATRADAGGASAGPPSGSVQTPVTSGVPATTAAPASVRCRNATHGYALAYPRDWHTAARDESESCRFFHPEPFEIPAHFEVAEVAIVVEHLDVSYDDWIAANQQAGIVVLERDDTTVAGGARAVRLRFSFAEGPEDMVALAYAIDRGAGVLVLYAFSPFSPDFTRTGDVLDAMVPSLELFR